MEKNTNVFIIKKLNETKEYENTNIAFDNRQGAADFCYNFINDEHRFSYKRGELSEGMKLYHVYEDFVKDFPQIEIDRLVKDRTELLVEFPFIVFHRNTVDGTTTLTKLEKLERLLILMCQKVGDKMQIRLSQGEYLEIDINQFAEFDKAVSKAKKQYIEISREIARVKDSYLPSKLQKEPEYDIEEVYRAFEE